MFVRPTLKQTGEIKMSEQQNENFQEQEMIPQSGDEHVPHSQSDEMNTSSSDENNNFDELNNNGSEDLPSEYQKKLGKTLSYERKRLRQEYESQLAELRQQISSPEQYGSMGSDEETIYDPETGENVPVNSTVGQLIQRNYKIAQRRKVQSAEVEMRKLSNAVDEGYSRFDHESYDQAKNTFINMGNDQMAEALTGADDPAAVINYLGSNPNELKRIAQLSPAKQTREIYRIDERMSPRKKLVTNASAPMDSINTNRNYAADVTNQSFDQRSDYWNGVINKR